MLLIWWWRNMIIIETIPAFQPQHKVFMKSGEMIHCNDKSSPLKLLCLHLGELGAFHVVLIYKFNSSESTYTASPSFFQCKRIYFQIMMIPETKDPDNSYLKNRMCGHAHNLQSYGWHMMTSARTAVCFTAAWFQICLISLLLKTLAFSWEKKTKTLCHFWAPHHHSRNSEIT